jgi:ABC-type cobalamin/Fe3+-siderophores transport system ATPase subunit/SAM-dependent methyltransferase
MMLTRLESGWLEPFRGSVGLPAASGLRKLGRVVVLAGPNGSGKSRFLGALRLLLDQANEVVELAKNGTSARDLKATLLDPVADPQVITHRRQQIAGLSLLESLGTPRTINICNLTQPSKSELQDAAATNAGDHARCVSGCQELGLRGAYEFQHVYLDAIARQLELRNRKDSVAHGTTIEAAERFNETLHSFLGSRVVPVLNQAHLHDATLFERAFVQNELSSGQKVLIAWAVALHAQARLGECIVIVDEPENHLHPDACLRALEALRISAEGAGGQIWIATHSVPIIAWAGADALHSVESGIVSYAGDKVQGVVDSLSGGEERRESLRKFLANADHFGFYHFVGQCLAAPGVVGASNTDSQETAFARFVNALRTDDRKLRILDYGAGQGRLADSIARAGAKLTGISYFLYDPDPSFSVARTEAAKRLEDLGAESAVIDELGTVLVKHNRVDLVVLCNVLHEIPPAAWITLFKALDRVLVEDGQIAIIEDQEPSVGELPHDKGFVLLDANEVAQLFGGKETNVRNVSPGANVAKGRISIFCIDRKNLSEATPDTVKQALRDLEFRAKGRVDAFRANKHPEQRDGRRHALYMLLAYNAIRCLEG